jgi:hypothetical protein
MPFLQLNFVRTKKGMHYAGSGMQPPPASMKEIVGSKTAGVLVSLQKTA